MTRNLFDDASMIATVLRVRDVSASIVWYREKLGLEPVHVGADGPEHPFASFSIAGSIVSLWQLPSGQDRSIDDAEGSSYVVVVMNADLEPVREALAADGVTVTEVRRSAQNELVWFYDLDGNRFELSRPAHA
jgi:catechol 2,3-dioxygenase-like lactoylglutathione lyase family enzyme